MITYVTIRAEERNTIPLRDQIATMLPGMMVHAYSARDHIGVVVAGWDRAPAGAAEQFAARFRRSGLDAQVMSMGDFYSMGGSILLQRTS